MMNISKYTAIAYLAFSQNISAAPIAYFDFNNDGVLDTSLLVNQGASFTADVYVSNVINDHGGLLSWGTQLEFDNTLLTGNNYNIDPIWPQLGVNNMIDNATGKAELLASALSGSTGTLALFSINFTADNAGTSALSLQELFPGNLTFTGFAGADGHDYDAEVDFSSATVIISAVPVPASLLLFLTGLVGLFYKASGTSKD